MTSVPRDVERVRLGISVSRTTKELLDDLVAQRRAKDRSAAVDLLANHYRARLADAALAAAAARVDPQAEASAPGVVGAPTIPPPQRTPWSPPPQPPPNPP